MAQIDILDINGKNVGSAKLKDSIFNIEPNKDVMFRYVDMQLASKRAGTASTKERAEVRGGGRKPWPQKGTGRARVGTTRSPLWRHGGVTHGPKPKDWSKKLNKKMKKLALKSALSLRFQEKNLIVLDDLTLDKPGTKNVKNILDNLGLKNEKVLLVLPEKVEKYENVKISGRNLSNVKVLIADNPGNSINAGNTNNIDGLNVFDLLKYEKIVLTTALVEKIEEVLG
ncbi:MAG: 50S ribosomal protein L4 [Kosmotogaceae bacterium]